MDKEKDDESPESILSEALEQWRVCVDAESQNREDALDDKRFALLGEQWPDKVRQDREAEGRPCLTINRMPQFLKQVVNDQRMNKPAIVVRPVDDKGDPQTAEILQGLIRNIEVTSSADVAYDVAFEDAVTMGFGYFRIVSEYADDVSFHQELRIEKVENAFTVYLDPSNLFNPQFAFVTKMVNREDFKAEFGFTPKPVPEGGPGEAMEGWYDGELVRVAEYWRIKKERRTIALLSNGATIDKATFNKELANALGVKIVKERTADVQSVVQYTMTGMELIEETGTPWAGQWIPIIPVLGETINVEGRRYFQGLIRHAKDSQRMFNFWRTASTELVALAPKAPFVGPTGAFDTDAAKWATANNKSHAFLQYDGPVAPQRQPFAGVPAGALQEALNAADDMKSVMGLHDASLGARSNETSGVAIRARQREGDVSTFNFVDNLSRSLQHAGRILVDLIPKIYDSARVVRILGMDDEPSMARINQLFMGQDGRAVMNDLSVGKYDVVVKVGPSFTTQREEATSSMLEFIQAYPPAAPILGDLLAKNMDWPDSDKVAQRLQMLLPQQVQQPDAQAQALQQQLQQQDAQARQAIEALNRQLKSMSEDKQLEAAKLKIDGYNAETNRIKATYTAMGPEQVQALIMQTLQQVLTSPDVYPVIQQSQPIQPPMQPMQVPPQSPQGPIGPM